MVARLSGDEFALLAFGTADAGVALAERVRAALERPFEIESLRLSVAASIGVAPARGGDPATLLRQADVAMYVAKLDRSVVAIYTPERDEYDSGSTGPQRGAAGRHRG